jgi:integrase
MAWLYKQDGSANWWLGYRVNGKQVLRSTGTPDRTEAEKQLAKVETMFGAHRSGALTEELFRLLTGKGAARTALASALTEWLTTCKLTTAPRTLEKYEASARDFRLYLNADEFKPLLTDITPETIRGYLLAKARTHSISTVNLERKILNVFFRDVIKNGQLTSNPMLAIKKFKDSQSNGRRSFTMAEISVIHSKCPDEFWRFMVVAGFYSGLRLGDLVCLRWGSVDFENDVLRLTTAKTRRAMTIPMAEPVRNILLTRQQAFEVTTPTTHVWPDQAQQYGAKGVGVFSNQFYEILTSAGLTTARSADHRGQGLGRNSKRQLSDVSFHSLRHSFVSMLKVTGGNQAIAKELAGHSSDLVSDAYTHLPPEVLAKAINALPQFVQ